MFDRNSFRPQLERLGDRDNPSYLWDPLPGRPPVSGDALNWVVLDPGGTTGRRAYMVEVPTSDGMIFGAYIPQTTVYQYGQPPQTIPAHWATSADCILTQVPSITRDGLPYFRGFTALSTYVGEIDLRQTAVMDEVVMHGGRLKQNDATALGGSNPNAGTLRVDMNLNWTDGTLNSNTTDGFINLSPHAAGLIHPVDGNDGDVDLGSTLTQLAHLDTTTEGGELVIEPGTVNLKDGKGFVVQKGRRLRCAPVPWNYRDITGEIRIKDQKDPVTPDDGVLKVEGDAKFIIQPKDRPQLNLGKAVVKIDGPNPVVDNAGSVTLVDRAELLFILDETKAAPPNPANPAPGVWQHDPGAGFLAPSLSVEAGCFITCGKRAQVMIETGGLILTERRDAAGEPTTSNQPPITISGEKETDGVVTLMQAALLTHQDPKVPLQLVINSKKGKAIRSSGQIELSLVRGDATKNDQIKTDGRIQLNTGSKVVMKWFKDEGFLPQVNDFWKLMDSSYADPMGVDPAISDNSTPEFPPLHVGVNGVDEELLVYETSADNKELCLIVERR